MAGDSTVLSTPGKAAAAAVVKITASVEAIDAAARTITLKGPRGNALALEVGPEVKNLDRIKVGDLVAVTYAEALSLELKKGGSGIRERSEKVTLNVRNPEHFKVVKVGDQVQATFVEAVAISIEPAQKPAAKK